MHPFFRSYAGALVSSVCLAIAVLLLVAAPAVAQPFDVVINNGRIIDPESKLDAVRHVGLRAGKIVAVSRQRLTGKQVIDARGLVVAPGFIDLHSHSVLTLPGARMQVMDGVTTALELEEGAIPLAGTYDRLAREGRPLNYGMSVSWRFARAFVTAGSEPELMTPEVANRVLGKTAWQGHIPSETSAKVLALVEQGLREGGIGVGANLGYMPDSNTEEFYAVAQLAKKYGNSPTVVHIRYNAPFGVKVNLASHEEVIAIAAMTGAHLHFCHLNSNANRHIPAMIAAVENARRLGVPITWEAYPYGAFSTNISAAYLEPDFLPNMGMKPNDIVYLKTGERIASNERLAQIRKDDPAGFAIGYLLDEKKPEDIALLDQAVVHPNAAIASDSTYWQVGSDVLMGDEWPLPANVSSHPRSAGTFSRVVGPYVRAGKLSLMDAIRKASLIPAQILETSVPQMRNKGRLKVGADADIVIFDPATIRDRATYERPAQTSEGIRHVFVNGVLVVANGELIRDARPGRAVRRAVAGR